MATILVLGGLAESLTHFRGPLLEEMRKAGHKVIACAPDAPGHVLNGLSAIGVEYVNVTLERAGLNPLKDAYTIFRLFMVFREIRPDIFLGYTIKPVIYGSLAARLAGVPYIYSMIEGLGYTFCSDDVKGRFLQGFVSRLYAMSLKWNKNIFFLNHDDLELFITKNIVKNPKQAVLINGIGLELDYYSPAPIPDNIAFIMIARLIGDKGVREYLKAAEIIKNKYPIVKFYLVGWIDENPASISKDELDYFINNKIIEFLGRLSDVRPAITQSSVYVLPSYYREGMPRTILEAMSMGRPVITTNAPGCRETVVDGQNGFLVPVKDVNALTAAMERFIKEPELIPVMGAVSRRMAVEKYDVRVINHLILKTMGLSNI